MRQWPSTSSRLALKRSTGVASLITVETKPGPLSVLCWISFSRASRFLLKARCDLIDSRIASRALLLFVRVCISVLAKRSTPDLAKTLPFDRAEIATVCPCGQQSSEPRDSFHLADLSVSNQNALKESAESGAELVQPGSCHRNTPNFEYSTFTRTFFN